jgi:subtilisin family serine protease/Tol biopolymer transport system component
MNARRFLRATFLLATVLGNTLAIAQTPREEHVPSRVVVVLRGDLYELPEQVAGPDPWASGMAELDRLLERVHARSMRRAILSTGLVDPEPARFHSSGLDRHFVVDLEAGSDELAARDELARSPLVVEAHFDGIVRAFEHPNDVLYGQQWEHHVAVGSAFPDIDTDLAWDVTHSGAGVLVAVLDTGCNKTHPDLAGAVNGEYDFINNDNDASDDNGHGTGVTGIIAARGNNGIGLAGVAWSVNILSVKVLDATGQGTMTQLASGINFARQAGAKIINMSLGAYLAAPDITVQTAIQNAAAADALCIAAVGNANANVIAYPAAMSDCMAVGATNIGGSRWVTSNQLGGSNYGREIDIVAPGVALTTTGLGASYDSYFTGTSGAAPLVAGVAALVRSLAPSLTQAKVRDILLDTADDLVGIGAEDTPGFDIYMGRGKLNANRAVLAVHPSAMRRVNLQVDGVQSTGLYQASPPVLSGDGRYVVYCSSASDIVAGDTNGAFDIFVLDRRSGITLWASQGLNHLPANAQSHSPSISDDGQWISFASVASNLVNGIGNGRFQAYVWDNVGHTMRLISANATGAPGDFDTFDTAISDNGRYVVFSSDADDLVAGDTNAWRDIFLRDRDTDGDGIFDEVGAVSTTRVSVGPYGAQSNSLSGDYPSAISTDGLHVTFQSYATNLIAGGSSGSQVFVRDLTTNTTALLSASCGYYGGTFSAISSNGRYVALGTDTNPAQILRIDRDSDGDGILDEVGATNCEIASRGAAGTGNGYSASPSISDDGRYVAYTSSSTNLVASDTNAQNDVFVRDTQLSITERVSVSTALAECNGNCGFTGMSNTGHEVVFVSDATNLVAGDTNGVPDVFLHESFSIDLLVTSFCFCTGAPMAAPCGNTAAAGQGCRNSTGVGAILAASGSSSIARDDLALSGTQLPPFRSALVFMGGGLLNGNVGYISGEGRMCVGSGGFGLYRFPVLTSNAAGAISVGPGVAGLSTSLFPSAAWSTAGSTWNFQCWYRDPSGQCGQGTNFTNALAVTFTP